MVAFLVLVHSVTGFVMLAVASLVVILCRKRNRKWVIAWLAAAGIVAAFCLVNIHSYYHLCPLAQEPLRAVTANGRPYTHQGDGFIECGNYELLSGSSCKASRNGNALHGHRSRTPVVDVEAL